MSFENVVVAGWSETQADCRLLFETNAHPMWVFSARSIVDVNRAALLHYDLSRDEFLSMSVEDLEATESVSGRIIGKHKKRDGSLFDVELSSFAITFAGLPATLWSACDVTYLNRAAAQTRCLDLFLATALGALVATDEGEGTIRALLANVITAQEGERRRVARELKEEAAQTLVSVLVGLRTVEAAYDLPGAYEAVGGLRTSVATVLHGVHRIVSGLRPSILDPLGLEPALEQLTNELSRGSGIFVDFRVTGASAPRLPESMEIALYRIAEEALTNAGKHSAAKTIRVLMHRNDEMVRLVIEDDGRGFDVAALLSKTQLGLSGDARARSLHRRVDDGALFGGAWHHPLRQRALASRGEGVDAAALMSIRVFIADDHGVLRGGLRVFISTQRDMEVVGEAANGPDAERGIQKTEPDVVLMDISMPGGGGLAAMAAVKRVRPKTRFLVLTGHDQAGYVRAATEAGALGYIVKSAVDTELLGAIRAVADGRTFMGVSLEMGLVQSGPAPGRSQNREPGTTALSEREREILARVAEGYTNLQIADELQLGIKSIETYRARVMEKLGLTSRSDLVRFALESGILAAGKQAP